MTRHEIVCTRVRIEVFGPFGRSRLYRFTAIKGAMAEKDTTPTLISWEYALGKEHVLRNEQTLERYLDRYIPWLVVTMTEDHLELQHARYRRQLPSRPRTAKLLREPVGGQWFQRYVQWRHMERVRGSYPHEFVKARRHQRHQ